MNPYQSPSDTEEVVHDLDWILWLVVIGVPALYMGFSFLVFYMFVW